MKINLKPGVNPRITVEFAVGLGWVKAQWELAGLGPFVVTSLKDGHHAARSQHRQNELHDVLGEAGDVRTRHLFIGSLKPPYKGSHSKKLIDFAKKLQRHGFRVVVHPDWLPGFPHLHFATGKPIFISAK